MEDERLTLKIDSIFLEVEEAAGCLTIALEKLEKMRNNNGETTC